MDIRSDPNTRQYTEPLLDPTSNNADGGSGDTFEFGRSKMTDIENKQKQEHHWPIAESSRAQFLVPASFANAGMEERCRIKYHAPTSTIHIVSYPEEDGDDHEERVIDVIDPRDVIGAELELEFHGGVDTTSRPVGIHNDKSQKRQAEHDKREEKKAQRMKSKKVDNDMDIGEAALDDSAVFQDENSSPGVCGGGEAVIPDVGEMEKLFSWDGLDGAFGGMIIGTHHATAYLNVYCYPRLPPGTAGFFARCNPFGSSSAKQAMPANDVDPKKLGHRHAHHRRLEVAPCEDFADARAIVRAIRRAARLGHFLDLDATPPPSVAAADSGEEISMAKLSRPRRYLVVVNPHSGTGKAKSIYANTVKPMLDQAGVEHDVCVTRYGGHAGERMSVRAEKAAEEGAPSSSTAEAKEGGAEEEDDERKDLSEYDGVVAMGGDGILFEVLQGIREREDAQDIFKKVTFGVVGCGTSNGLAKSVLEDSQEKYSPLESTFLICKGQTKPIDLAHYELLSKKTYLGVLTFTWALVADLDIESECIRCLGSARTDIWAVWRILNLRRYSARFSYLPASKVDDLTKAVNMPGLSDPVPSDWEVIDDSIIVFWACQVTHASYDILNSPLSGMQDGLFHVLVVRGSCSRFKLMSMFLQMEAGTHIETEECEIYDCAAWRLEPQCKGSFNDVDGEHVESGPIQAHVLPAGLQFFRG